MSQSIDFKDLKARVSLEAVLLDYYKLQNLKRRGHKLIGPCPVHGGNSPRAFHADLRADSWYCFSRCHRGGDQLTLVAGIEGVSIRDAALKLAEHFLTGYAAKPPPRPRPKPTTQATPRINRPLEFTLTLKHQHQHLQQTRGLSLETCRAFDIGYCQHGMFRGCIAIPIHDHNSQLVAYAGRRLHSDDIEQYGKYKFPKGFHKELVLFNLHRAKRYAKDKGVILVEGFFSVLFLANQGIPNAVAAMGSSLAKAQATRLLATDPVSVTIVFDGNAAGHHGGEAARALLAELAPDLPVHVVELPDNHEPEDMTPDDLEGLT